MKDTLTSTVSNFKGTAYRLKKKFQHYLIDQGIIDPYLNKANKAYGRQILVAQEGNNLIRKRLVSQEPTMIARIGGVELQCLNCYLKGSFDTKVKNRMYNPAGFFPNTEDMLVRFSEEFLKHLSNVDILAVWYNKGEDKVARIYCPDTDFVELRAVEPYFHQTPWSASLKGKTVLVVHPFEHSIRNQLKNNRQYIFSDSTVLPDFHLKTLKTVQSIGNAPNGFATWFDAYEYMCEKIAQIEFDIAIIGAGAYGLPLASFVKSLGKSVVHMGGATQILFGIKGRRWEEKADFANLFNEYWVRPSEEERPTHFRSVEDGCYW